MNQKTIRAQYDSETLLVYQAFNSAIAKEAIATQSLGPPHFSMNRMTWIKPSFFWMMYRSGWATKENQEHILAIYMKRSGFEALLKQAVMSRFEESIQNSREAWSQALAQSDVRIQWDPERDFRLNKLPYRAIQIGIRGKALRQYTEEWITEIKDVTEECKQLKRLIDQDPKQISTAMLPQEKVYPLAQEIGKNIGIE